MGGGAFDSGKINQLFDKIGKLLSMKWDVWVIRASLFLDLTKLLTFVERANNIEIEERSIKNLAQKLSL